MPLLKSLLLLYISHLAISGGDLYSVSTGSAIACASACDNNAQCVGWVWDLGGSQTCWLKNAITSRGSNAARVSGVKQGQVGVDRVGNDLPGMR